MGAALDHAPASIVDQGKGEPLATTLLELVEAVGDVSKNEREVVATVSEMIRSGKVQLTGCFRNAPRRTFRL